VVVDVVVVVIVVGDGDGVTGAVKTSLTLLE